VEWSRWKAPAVLTGEQVRALLDSIDTSTVVGSAIGR